MANGPVAAPSIIPSPDPSRLTLEVLHRELELQKELATAREEKLLTRLDAMQKAGELLEQNVNRVPTLLDREIKALKENTNERFKSVSDLFIEKFSGVAAQLSAIKEFAAAMRAAADTAIAAAFAAADKVIQAQNSSNMQASQKSEAAFFERVKSQENLLNSTKETFSIDINAQKDRLTKLEALSLGARDSRTEQRLDMGSTLGTVAVTVTIVSAAVAVLSFIVLHH